MEIRTEFLDEEQAALFAELGCTLQIGLQTADEAVAAGIGRPFSAGEFRDRILLLHEYGVVYGLDLIWGLPGDSLEGFRRSLDFALSCAPNHLDMFPLSVLPGTRLRAEAAGRGLPHLPEPPYTVTGTTSFPAGDLEAAAVLAGQVEFFYNECRAVPWFLILCDALDLGPVRLMERAGDLAGDGRPPQKNRPEWLQGLVRDLAASAGKVESAELLGDLVAVLTLESAARQGLEIPEVLRFTFRPDILLGHLEMGISDLDELAAFVPREPGKFGISTDDGTPVFRERRT